MAEADQAQFPLAQRIAILKIEIATCFAKEGESFQTRYHHDWAILQQEMILASAPSNIEECTSMLKKLDPDDVARANLDTLVMAGHQVEANAAQIEMNKQRSMFDEAVKVHRDTYARRKMLQQQLHELEIGDAADEDATRLPDAPDEACGCLQKTHSGHERE